MRRIQIYIEEELDERLQAEAARTGRSKASLALEWLRRHDEREYSFVGVRP